MRPLTDEETVTFFKKLTKFLGKNTKFLLDRKDEPYCFRLQRQRVYYVSEKMMRMATNIARDKLVALGTCFGKFTKGGAFHLQITCLEHLAQFAKYKVWVKPSAEMSFLYGNHVTKAGLGRITEGVPQHAGVVVFNMSNVPLGFGLAAQSTDYCRTLDPTGYVVLHQADVGEYLRTETSLN